MGNISKQWMEMKGLTILDQAQSLNKHFERYRRKTKVIKERKAQSTFVLGEDVGLEAMVVLSETTLISKFMHRNISKLKFYHWIEKHMSKFLGYIP